MSPEERIDRSFDGQLSDAEWEALQRDLLEDDALRELYVQRRWLHAQLQTERDSLPSILETSPPKKRSSLLPWLAAAAGVAIAAGSFFLSPEPAPPVVATLVEANDCRWEGSDLPTNEGADLTTGTLALAEGMATIRFVSGATVTLEAPTVLQVDSAMKCRLIEGSVVADVPESAHGFTIDTEKLEVVDLGTRFGVTSSPVAGAHVFVFDGEVTVREENEEEAQHVLGGRSVHFGADPTPENEEVKREQPDSSRSGNWTAYSTAIGRGKDAFIRNGDSHGPTGSLPLLMVKHTDLVPSNQRRMLMTFDLDASRHSEANNAALSLKIESSGLGFSALVPDSAFTVYGAIDPSLHEWSESALTWKNSPDLTRATPDPEQFKPLADFTIAKGASNGIIDIESEALSEFVRQSPEDRVTFLIVRNTGEFDKQGLVHAFASKEHPSSPAPTLWIEHPDTP